MPLGHRAGCSLPECSWGSLWRRGCWSRADRFPWWVLPLQPGEAERHRKPLGMAEMYMKGHQERPCRICFDPENEQVLLSWKPVWRKGSALQGHRGWGKRLICSPSCFHSFTQQREQIFLLLPMFTAGAGILTKLTFWDAEVLNSGNRSQHLILKLHVDLRSARVTKELKN